MYNHLLTILELGVELFNVSFGENCVEKFNF